MAGALVTARFGKNRVHIANEIDLDRRITCHPRNFHGQHDLLRPHRHRDASTAVRQRTEKPGGGHRHVVTHRVARRPRGIDVGAVGHLGVHEQLEVGEGAIERDCFGGGQLNRRHFSDRQGLCRLIGCRLLGTLSSPLQRVVGRRITSQILCLHGGDRKRPALLPSLIEHPHHPVRTTDSHFA